MAQRAANGSTVSDNRIGDHPLRIVQDPEVKARQVETIMQPAFPFADISMGMEALSRMITPETPAVLVRDFKSQETYIITRWDVIRALG